MKSPVLSVLALITSKVVSHQHPINSWVAKAAKHHHLVYRVQIFRDVNEDSPIYKWLLSCSYTNLATFLLLMSTRWHLASGKSVIYATKIAGSVHYASSMSYRAVKWYLSCIAMILVGRRTCQFYFVMSPYCTFKPLTHWPLKKI